MTPAALIILAVAAWLLALGARMARRSVEATLQLTRTAAARDPATGLLQGAGAQRRLELEQELVDRLDHSSQLWIGRTDPTMQAVVARRAATEVGASRVIQLHRNAVVVITEARPAPVDDVAWEGPLAVVPRGDALGLVSEHLEAAP